MAAGRIAVYNWPHLLMSTSVSFIGPEMCTSSFLTTEDKSEPLNLGQPTVFVLGPFLDVGCFNKLFWQHQGFWWDFWWSWACFELRSLWIQGDFEGRMGIFGKQTINKRLLLCSQATQRKTVFVSQDVINIASSFNFSASKIRKLALHQGRAWSLSAHFCTYICIYSYV